MRRVARLLFVLTVLIAAVTAASAGPATAEAPPEYFVDETKLPFAAIPGIDTDRYWGIHNGAGYRIEVPRNWNNRLVMWAHGFAAAGSSSRSTTIRCAPSWPRTATRGRRRVTPGTSTTSRRVKDTHALTLRFNGIVGKPDLTYLTGASMGGHVTAAAIEQYPQAYDGAMPICGVLGDHELFDFYLDYNLVSAALAGVATTFPPDPVQWLTVSVPQIRSTWRRRGRSVSPRRREFKSLTERSGGERPLFDAAWLSWASFLQQFRALDGTVPRRRASSSTTPTPSTSSTPIPPQPGRAGAERRRAARRPDAGRESRARGRERPGRERHDGPGAHAARPRRPVRPVLDGAGLRAAGRRRGSRTSWCSARSAESATATTATELVTGFTDLVRWVEAGVHPAGDNVLDPAVVASPTYGCAAFTTTTRNLGPFTAPCP